MAFFAMFWNQACTRQYADAQSIKLRMKDAPNQPLECIEAEGLLLANLSHEGSRQRILALPGSNGAPMGALFGQVFAGAMPGVVGGPLRTMSIEAANKIFRSDGRRLLSDYWGSYVAFLNCGRLQHVIQEPTAALPCYYTRHNNLTLVFSHIEACGFLDLSGWSVNRNYVSALLAYDKTLDGETGLNGVSELLSGEALTRSCSGDLSVSAYWDPRSIAQNTLVLPDRDAEILLAETVHSVVAARASSFQEIIVSVSGGLDSAIVLACLASSCDPATLRPVHYRLSSGDETEEQFAAEAAQHVGLSLKTIAASPTDGFPQLEDFPATARPYRQFIAPDLRALLPPRMRKEGSAWFTGQGGDHLFHVARNPLCPSSGILRQKAA